MALGALLAAAALSLGWIAWHRTATSDPRAGGARPHGPDISGRAPLPPDPSRSFRDHTPEQRIDFARKGRGPGG